ncbi:MAG: CHASE2 domain-containing protein [Bryobacteraceae bacterium]
MALIVVASAGGTVMLGKIRFMQLVHLKFQDFQFVLRGKLPVDDILLITMDQTTLDTYEKPLIFWHKYYADAIEAAARGGAKVLGLDVAFGIPVDRYLKEEDHDGRLVEAVATAASLGMPAIIGYVDALLKKQKDWPVPINMVSSSMGQAGYANLTVDSDDFVRWQQLTEAPGTQPPETLARSLATRVAEKFRGQDMRWEQGRLLWGDRLIPADPMKGIVINYAGPPNTFNRIPLVDFLKAAKSGNQAQIEKWVKGKAVLLGPDYDEDRHATPYYTVFGLGKWNTAGVEIHASTLRTLLTGQYLVPIPAWTQIVLLFLVATATVAIVARYGAVRGAVGLFIAVFTTGGLTHLMFRRGILISTSELLLSCLLALIGTSLYRMLTAEKRGAVFQSAIQLFVGKELAKSLSETENISLSGRSQILTILFTDIRGFTAFCESKDPAAVVDLLNDYMGKMVSIIVAYHGHVNKFIGDGILAIFTDEDEGAKPGDHATRAVLCAREMVTTPCGDFRTGAGIHTGPAIVGNVGSKDKMEYTVLGDTVNLASRLESLNKEMKSHMILSEETREILGDGINLYHLGHVPIRGKTEPLNVYTVLELAPKRPEVEAAAEKA